MTKKNHTEKGEQGRLKELHTENNRLESKQDEHLAEIELLRNESEHYQDLYRITLEELNNLELEKLHLQTDVKKYEKAYDNAMLQLNKYQPYKNIFLQTRYKKVD